MLSIAQYNNKWGRDLPASLGRVFYIWCNEMETLPLVELAEFLQAIFLSHNYVPA